MFTEPQTQVLIIGAGPTGLTLALDLASAGIEFRIVDKIEQRSDKSRALAVQSRTTELMERYYLEDEFYDRGEKVHELNFIFNQNKPVIINGDAFSKHTDCKRPYPTLLSQKDTEEILERKLEQYDSEVEYGTTVDSLKQDPTGCTCVLKRTNGTSETLFSRYVAGCDGAHSIVRHSCPSIAFEGDQYLKGFSLIDCRAECSQDSLVNNKITIMSGMGALGLFPLNDDCYRFFWPSDQEGPVTTEEFYKVANKVCPYDVKIKEVIWSTRYKLHHRLATSYRDKRFFILGDAAHIHSPAGGQGMNTGIQDATNLGWKLAHVLNGRASDDFLDSYNQERRRIGEKLLNYTDKLFGFVMSDYWLYNFLRTYILNWVAPIVLSSESMQAKLFGFGTQLKIKYSKSDIVDKQCGNGGHRAPNGDVVHCQSGECRNLYKFLSPGRFVLLVFGDVQLPDSLGNWIIAYQVVHKPSNFTTNNRHVLNDVSGELHKLYGDNRVVLIRPDAHIASSAKISNTNQFKTFVKHICKDELDLSFL